MDNSNRATVFIIDDDPSVLSALESLMKSENLPVKAFRRARDFFAQYRPEQPGCLLLDVDMPDLDGFEVQAELKRKGVLLPIIFISGYGDIPLAVKAIKRGAMDFVVKPFRLDQMLERIRLALQEDSRRCELARQNQHVQQRFAHLTKREREVLDKIIDGLPNKTIAHNLGISPRTVEIHRSNIMHKLECRSVAQLVQLTLLGPGRANRRMFAEAMAD